jgi:uroporphyrinogen decarboxylase
MHDVSAPLRAPDKNRILAAFSREKSDRVPTFEVLVDEPTVSHVLGREVPGGHTLANIDPSDYLEFAKHIGQDVIGMCFYDNPFHYIDESGNARKLDFPIKSRADLDRLLPVNDSHMEHLFTLLRRYEDVVKGTNVGLFALTASFFTDAYNSIFGFDNFMYTLYDDLDLIDEILERLTVYFVAQVKRLMEYDLTFLYIGDDIAHKSTTLIDPDVMRSIWLPRMRRIMAPAVEKGLPILFHSDGNIYEMIPDILDLGISALNPIEPYGMDILEVKRNFGKHLTLVGNLDVGASLSSGTPEDVRSDAEQLIDAVGRDGGLVLASSHSITRNVKPENFLAMIDTAQTYGVFDGR